MTIILAIMQQLQDVLKENSPAEYQLSVLRESISSVTSNSFIISLVLNQNIALVR